MPAQQPAGTLAPQRRGHREYAFLVGTSIDQAGLDHAEAEAGRCGVATHEVLLSSGAVSPMAYAAALAHRLQVPLAGWETLLDIRTDEDTDDLRELGLPGLLGGQSHRVLCAEDRSPDDLWQHVAALQARGLQVALAPRFRIEAALEQHWRAARIDEAVRGLFRRQPASSAAGDIWLWQVVAAAIAVGLIVGGFSVVPDATIAALTGLVAVPFLCITLLRAVALREVMVSSRKRAGEATADLRLADHLLPTYTVLAPLLGEANVLAGLVQSLRVLDYPTAKLEILLILEAADIETQAAVLSLELPGNFRTIVVPDAPPQTKPKALNYALQFARGDYVVVYDAEDRPEADQLRRAIDAFRRHPPNIGCVQAQLNIYNPRGSWFFARQFTIEYSALFDAILPAVSRLGLPVPLGGTSNHFERATLVAAGGWDPFNVTEDADLGFRLARLGWRTTVLASTTWEEAPTTFSRWFRQRTRWLKGWMQTYLVHTRQPWRLNAELGFRAALGLHALMGALLLSALAHPVFYVLLAYHALSGQLFTPAETIAGAVLWIVACINLGAGYLISILVGALSVWRRGRPGLALSALLMPLTWLLISAAAYRALYQLATDPYLWEKTEHGTPRRSRRRLAGGRLRRLRLSSSGRANHATRHRTD